jgi:hypothetical protein
MQLTLETTRTPNREMADQRRIDKLLFTPGMTLPKSRYSNEIHKFSRGWEITSHSPSFSSRSSRCGSHILDDELQRSASAKRIPINRKSDVPRWIRKGVFSTTEEDGVLFVVALAKHETQVVVLHVQR